MKARMLVLLALACAAPALQAQPAAPYGYYGYPQQPVFYPNVGPPYSNPRQPRYDNDYGVTYYYVADPKARAAAPVNFFPPGTNWTPTNRVPTTATSWPAPAGRPAPALRAPNPDPAGIEPAEDPRIKPIIPFHRPTNECFWISGDYAALFIRPMRLAGPLVTSGSPAVQPSGGLGQPSTVVLFSNQNVDFGLFSAVHLEAGLFVDQENRFSLDWRALWVMPVTQTFSIASNANGSPQLSRPIFNVATGLEGVLVNSLINASTGSISVENKSDMQGFELNGRYHTYYQGRWHFDSLAGFRYLRLAERLRIQEQITPLTNNFLTFLGNNVNAPDSLADEDSFRTTNQFFGPQIGGRVSYEQRWFTLDAFAKLALGITAEQVTINGSTTLVSPNGNQTVPGGVLALPTNIGTHNRTVFGLVPEFGLNLGVDLTQHVRVNLGYSFLIWNHVLRPGSQFDRGVNPGQVPSSPTFGTINGALLPSYRFNDELFFLNSFTIGMEFHY